MDCRGVFGGNVPHIYAIIVSPEYVRIFWLAAKQKPSHDLDTCKLPNHWHCL